MTFSEIRDEVRRRLRESSDSPVFWSDADIDVSINEGLAELADATEFHEKWQKIEILEDRPYYDMRTIARDEFLVCGPAFNTTTNRWLDPTSPRELELGDLEWEGRTGEPEYFMVRGLWWVGYWPVKATEEGEIKQYYIGIPDAMVEDADVPPIHTAHHYALVEFALADLFAQDGEADLAWASWKEYGLYEARVKKWMNDRATVPKDRRFAPTDYGA
jgi:hypothetical protein